MKTGSEFPTYYLMGVGVSHQMQIADGITQCYIGDVTYPQLVGRSHNQTFHQILIFMETVVAVGRAAAPAWLEHQMITAQEIEKGVSTHHLMSAINLTHDEIEFETPYTGSLATNLVYRRQKDMISDFANL
jgi:hypothetical protein